MALITGASGGLGLHIARSLQAKGVQAGGLVLAVPADIGSPDDRQALVDAALS